MQRVRRSLFQPSSSGIEELQDSLQLLQEGGLPDFPPPLVEFPRSPSSPSLFPHSSGFIGENCANLFPLDQQEQQFPVPGGMEYTCANWMHSPVSGSTLPPLPPHSPSFPLLADPAFLENPPVYVNYLTDAHKSSPVPQVSVPRNSSDCPTLAYERPMKRRKDENADSSPSSDKRKDRRTSLKATQSVAAKERRERISERLKILQDLVPNGSKVDLVTMLEKAINYVKFMQLQIEVLTTDQYWPNQASKDQPRGREY